MSSREGSLGRSARTSRSAALGAALLALCLAACETVPPGVDGGGEDAGRDAGRDGGPDAGAPDAGPPQTFTARLVNDVPGYAAVEVCMWLTVDGVIVPSDTPGILLTAGDLVVPFRGVSSYIRSDFFVASPLVDFLVALYDAAAFGGTCPNDPSAAGAPRAALVDRIVGAELTVGATYSIIATGFAEGTLDAEEGELPSRCDPLMGFTRPCGEATGARLVLVDDDLSEPADGRARLRVANMVPNVQPLGFMVCYDPELVPSPDMAMAARGACVEASTMVDPVALTPAPLLYGAVTEYVERDPIQPTLPGIPPGVGGGIYLAAVPPTTTSCPPFSALPVQRCLPILGAFPTPPGADNIQPNLEAGDVTTLFIQGALGVTEAADPREEDYRVRFFLWQDDLGAP